MPSGSEEWGVWPGSQMDLWPTQECGWQGHVWRSDERARWSLSAWGIREHSGKNSCSGGESGRPWPKDGGSGSETKGSCTSSPPICSGHVPPILKPESQSRKASWDSSNSLCIILERDWDSNTALLGNDGMRYSRQVARGFRPSFHSKHCISASHQILGPPWAGAAGPGTQGDLIQCSLDTAPTEGGTFMDLLAMSQVTSVAPERGADSKLSQPKEENSGESRRGFGALWK